MATQYLILIESLSLLLQLWAAVSAIILGFYTKKTKAWLFITIAFLLMVIRRFLRFPQLLAADFSGLSATDIAMELIALLISLLLALGITAILLLVRSLKGSQLMLETHSHQLEKLVAERTAEYREANEQLKSEIEARKKLEEQQKLLIAVLDLLNRENKESNYIGEILSIVRSYSEIEAVAIRLFKDNVYSYYQSEGFPEDFIESVRSLCNIFQEGNLHRDSTGKPLLTCMCDSVIHSRVNSELPFYTPGGSFWTNSTSGLWAAATKEDRYNTACKCCHEAGYESVALIPLHLSKRIIGLLQFNDHRKGCFAPDIIAFWERFGSSVGIALERNQRQEELAAANKQLKLKTGELQSANEELAQYNYVISHDIRSPLRAIHNYTDFLYEDLEATLEGEQKSYLTGLKSAVQEADYLVERLLEFSRIGRQDGPVESIDLGVFLEKLIVSLNLKVQIKIQMQELWPQVQFDRLLLQQVFQNLLTNAVKFNNSEPKEAELGWQQTEAQKYEIFIRDNGIGIDPRYQDLIFNVFERLHTKEEYEGTGMGLAIVKKALHTMNGDIRVESNPGRGSTFFITLPATEEGKKNDDRQ